MSDDIHSSNAPEGIDLDAPIGFGQQDDAMEAAIDAAMAEVAPETDEDAVAAEGVLNGSDDDSGATTASTPAEAAQASTDPVQGEDGKWRIGDLEADTLGELFAKATAAPAAPADDLLGSLAGAIDEDHSVIEALTEPTAPVTPAATEPARPIVPPKFAMRDLAEAIENEDADRVEEIALYAGEHYPDLVPTMIGVIAEADLNFASQLSYSVQDDIRRREIAALREPLEAQRRAAASAQEAQKRAAAGTMALKAVRAAVDPEDFALLQNEFAANLRANQSLLKGQPATVEVYQQIAKLSWDSTVAQNLSKLTDAKRILATEAEAAKNNAFVEPGTGGLAPAGGALSEEEKLANEMKAQHGGFNI